MKEKTVREWLNELPEPIRTRALRNEDGENTNDISTNISDAIGNAFYFHETIEGIRYWKLVKQGKYSEACALLGETLQTEQTEPHYMETAIDQAIREIANKEYGKFWVELNDSQKAHLIVPVAIRYAELVNNQNK